jgi:hypothetical protein
MTKDDEGRCTKIMDEEMAGEDDGSLDNIPPLGQHRPGPKEGLNGLNYKRYLGMKLVVVLPPSIADASFVLLIAVQPEILMAPHSSA